MISQFDDIWFIKEDGVHYGRVAYIEEGYVKIWQENSPLIEALKISDENITWFKDKQKAMDFIKR